MSGSRTRVVRLVAAAAAILAAGLLPVGAGGASSAAPAIEALSTLPQYVSGGDVLVEIRLHDDAASLKQLRIEANGRDVSGSFRTMPDGSLRGLVGGLALGENEIVARANGNGKGTPPGRSATLRVVNHPLSGPMFSGPQQEPFFCETVQNGLGPALDADCSAPTQVRYQYRTTAGAFAALADPTVKPADLATHDDARRPDRRLHRSDREGRDRPRRLRDRRPLRPGRAAEPVHGRARLERTAGLHVRRRLQRRLPPGPGERRRAHRPLPRARLRRRVVVPERLRQQLQRGDLGRGRADGEGALRRDVREAEVHDRLRRLGRRDPAAPDREQLPGHPRRDHPERLVPGLDHARNRARTAGCSRCTSPARPASLPAGRPRSALRPRASARSTRASSGTSPSPAARTRSRPAPALCPCRRGTTR